MGRRNKEYALTLNQQVYERLKSMLDNGEGHSKKEDSKNKDTDNRIYSYNTYDTYRKHCNYFVDWLKSNHPNISTLKNAKKYVGEYLQSQVDKGLSAYTVSTKAAALNKLYGIKPDDADRFRVPNRTRCDIKRSRVDTARDKHFSVTNNAELIKFAQATGLRRMELAKLKGKDYISKSTIEKWITKYNSQENLTPRDKQKLELLKDTLYNFRDFNDFVYVKGKGGKERIAPILDTKAAERIKSIPKDAKVWQYIHSAADIHSYRGDYATALYKRYARDIDSIPSNRTNKGSGKRYQHDVYVCRKDEKGRKLDRNAMYRASKALGHNRVDVIAKHYLRGI